jgi:hypothetical protein
MADEMTFTPEEWETLRSAPVLAGMAVASASKSGQWAGVKEEAALYDAIDKTATDASEIAVIQEIAASIKQTPPAVSDNAETTYRERALSACAAVCNVLDAKFNPVSAQRYRNWVISASQRVAEASKEGALLGFIGGKRVSDEEAQMLADIETALHSQLGDTALGVPGLESDGAPVAAEQPQVPFMGDAAAAGALFSPPITEREITGYVRPDREAREVY